MFEGRDVGESEKVSQGWIEERGKAQGGSVRETSSLKASGHEHLLRSGTLRDYFAGFSCIYFILDLGRLATTLY